uniref:F-box domain-containing protein n=1 Tax=Steinernema glaseri TaxID=37863 RepID=A0A1I7YTN3_9BILA
MERVRCAHCSSEKSTLNRLPDELLERIGDHLDVEDLHSFMQSSPFINLALIRSLRNFHSLQISDDSSSCFVENRRSKLRKRFSRGNLPLLYAMFPEISEIVVIVKDMIAPSLQVALDEPSTSDPLLKGEEDEEEDEEEEVMETEEAPDSGTEDEFRPADFLQWPCPKHLGPSRLLSPATAEH